MRELLEIGASIGLDPGPGRGRLDAGGGAEGPKPGRGTSAPRLGGLCRPLAGAFAEWGLTASEKDVALFAIKGMSTADIAGLRSTSEGTVKAQTNAIYRKAGVSGRSQLLSLFIEDLMRDDGAVRIAANSKG
jgi:DNA-binding CsgD family transcriptional regulator